MDWKRIVLIVFLIWVALWIRNILRAVRSGDFKQRLEAAREAKADRNPYAEAAQAWIAEEQARADTMPDPTPDKPALIGRFRDWIAVRSQDPTAAAEVLHLKDTAVANWATGCAIADSRVSPRIFVSAPVEGWIFVVGSLPDDPEDSAEQALLPTLRRLSEHFGDAQYFFFSSVVMVQAWIRAINGQIQRAYWMSLHIDPPRLILNEGPITPGEREAGYICGESGYTGPLNREQIEDRTLCCLFEEATGDIAAQWGLSPDALHRRQDLPLGAGIVGVWPATG